MIEISWLLFVTTSLVLIATPGQDMILVMSRSVAQGTSSGVATALGVSLGLIGHTLLATVGLGAILRTSTWLFFTLKIGGAGYLVYLGVGLLRAKGKVLVEIMDQPKSFRRLLLDGALSNVSNPKVAIFYFSFLPQFVLPHSAQPTLAIFILGLAFAGLTFAVKAPVALSAGYLSGWLRSRPDMLQWLHRSAGAIYIGLGAKLALEKRP